MSLPAGVADVPGVLQPPPLLPGVVITPPAAVHIDVHDQVSKFLKTEVAPGKTVALVSLTTDRGLNFALAHKRTVTEGFLEGDWVVESWIGKSGFDKPLAGGIQVMWST